MNDYDKGFNEAVNRILTRIDEQAQGYAQLNSERLNVKDKSFHYKALALIDLKLYLEQLFKTEIMESEVK